MSKEKKTGVLTASSNSKSAKTLDKKMIAASDQIPTPKDIEEVR